MSTFKMIYNITRSTSEPKALITNLMRLYSPSRVSRYYSSTEVSTWKEPCTHGRNHAESHKYVRKYMQESEKDVTELMEDLEQLKKDFVLDAISGERKNIQISLARITSRIDFLETFILSPKVKLDCSKYERWIFMFENYRDNTGFVEAIHERLKAYEITPHEFIKSVTTLYDFLTPYYTAGNIFPSKKGEVNIERLLYFIGALNDEVVRKSLIVLLQPF